MPYTEGAQGSPVDTQDRLNRVGSKYQETPPAVDDGDNVYLMVDAAGRLYIAGGIAHGSPDAVPPVKGGGKAISIVSASTVDIGDVVDASYSTIGGQYIHICDENQDVSAARVALVNLDGVATSSGGLQTRAMPYLIAPDGAQDRGRSAGDSGPGLGAQNVAPIGGDVTLRASAVAGEASGTSTAVDALGWVKSFNAHLDVTAAPSGGSPTLDVYLQTQLASGDWQDIAHFTQATGVTAEIMDWGPASGNFSGIGAEGAAVTYDRFFAEQDGALAATTIRVMNLGDSMRVKWAFAAGGSSGDFTFAVTSTPHS